MFKMEAYKFVSLFLSEVLKFEKEWDDFDDTLYGHYTMKGYSKLVLLYFLQ
jgi:hypothetical protein